MGTWGPGNFDSDTAADHLEDLTARLVAEVTEAMAGDPEELGPDEYWGVAVPCNLELLHLIAQRSYVGTSLPDETTLRDWRTSFLAAWDDGIDALAPVPGFKEQRRAVLERTFDQLLAEARRRAAEPSD